MGKRSVEGLAALCLVANGFVAKGFTGERLRDGRITHITTDFEAGKFVARVFSGRGAADYYAKGESALGEDDARAQALQTFWCWELDQAATRPGDAVELRQSCF